MCNEKKKIHNLIGIMAYNSLKNERAEKWFLKMYQASKNAVEIWICQESWKWYWTLEKHWSTE